MIIIMFGMNKKQDGLVRSNPSQSELYSFVTFIDDTPIKNDNRHRIDIDSTSISLSFFTGTAPYPLLRVAYHN